MPNEAKHTPGPWWLSGKGTVRCGDILENGNDGRGWIATVNWKNRTANAHLIAAAPELLAALKAFNLKEEWIVTGTADTLTLRVPLTVIQQAAAAVSKAEAAS